MSYDLSFVAPHRRDEVLRRIAVLEQFAAKPGRAAAQRGASKLGLGMTQFYRLAKVWLKHRKPERLAGAATARPRKTFATPEQIRFVELAVSDRPHDSVAGIASCAVEMAASAGVPMPSINSVRKIVEMKRVARVAPNSPAAGADVVVATCAIDVPVVAVDGSLTMPVATMVILALPKPRVLGLVLSFESGRAATVACALIGVCNSSRTPSQATMPVIAIERGRGPNWSELFHVIAAAGAEIRPMGARAHSVMNDAVALLGRKPAGFRLVPDVTAKPVNLRRPRLAAGATPLSLTDAESLVRGRLVVASPSVAPPGLIEEAAQDLARRLHHIAGFDST
ncbi:MAG: hypothetical protein K2Y20_13070 [Sphingomonas sp.]|nr:hypothetical protein [Sphingomonas sp.]